MLIKVKKEYINNAEKYYYKIANRDTNEIIVLDSYIIKAEEEDFVFQVILDFQKLKETINSDSIWDIYLVKEEYFEILEKRVVSSKEHFQFYSIVDLDNFKIFYPYTTLKNRLSFEFSDFKMFSEIDNVSIAESTIDFSGYFNFSPYYRTNKIEIEDMNISVENSEDELITQIPIKSCKREDIYNNYIGDVEYKELGFKGSLNINEIFDKFDEFEGISKFKLFLNINFKYEDEIISESSRIKITDISKKVKKVKKVILLNGIKYIVNIVPTKKAKYLSLQISIYSFKKELKGKLVKKWLKIKRSKNTIKIYKKIFSFVGKFPAKKNLIVFESFIGKQYSDNPRAIYEYLKENYTNLEMYWSVDKKFISNFDNKGLKIVKQKSIKWLFVMARAKYWVFNTRLPLWIPKPNHTIYLQTWHGTPLKKLATDMEEVRMPGTNTIKYKKNFVTEANRWDYLISPNAYSTEIFARAFQYEGIMIETGYPRNDILINLNNENEITKTKEKLNIPLNKKIILYAPTWRDNQFYGKGKYKFDLELDLNLLKEKLNDDYIIILRLHYLIAENLDLAGFEGFVYNFSNYADIRELYLMSDILITDYSSVFFDYANLKRPMIFFVYDIEDYRDNLRGFYFDFEKYAPGPLVKTTDEIIDFIHDIDNNGFYPSQNIIDFYNKFCYLEDGNATKRVVDEVFKL